MGYIYIDISLGILSDSWLTSGDNQTINYPLNTPIYYKYRGQVYY